jgi:acetamidase/formamidase/AraC-like DNA-binding protein
VSVLQFSAELFAVEERASAWAAALRGLGLLPRECASGPIPLSSGPIPLYGSIASAVSASGTRIARITCGGQRLVCRLPDSGYLWLLLPIDGSACIERPDTAHKLGVGDIAFGVAESATTLTGEANARLLFLGFSRATMESGVGSAPVPAVARLPTAKGIAQVFAAMLRGIAEAVEHFTPEDLMPIEFAAGRFLAAVLAGEAAAQPAGMAGTTQRAFQRICRIIEQRLDDPRLALPGLAKDQGVSPRYLQKLFEGAGERFGHYVRVRRLERCRADLADPMLAGESVAAVGFRWAFTDAAHFSRAFREHFGVSPRAYRQNAGRLRPAEAAPASRGAPASAQRIRPEPPPRSQLRCDFLPSNQGDSRHYIPASPETVHWGYFSRKLPPVATVASGEIVVMETLTHHANDDRERMVLGDAGAERVFHWTAGQKAVDRRGAGPMDATIYGRGAGEGFGVHLCTGPVAVSGAKPGDVLEVLILDIAPRPCANPRYAGRVFGSNAATWWGYHYNEFITGPAPREVVTIYELANCRGGSCAHAIYNFRWTPQTDPFGVVHRTIDYPGVLVDHQRIEERHGVLAGIHIPARPHFGVIGLAPNHSEMVDSVPPSAFGGNIDNWRIGRGARVFLPVEVAGALLSVGDPHASQGDGEVCGTAIECSLTGTFQLVLHPRGSLTSVLEDLTYPLVETPDEWIIHGFSHPNYLAELGAKAQSEIYQRSSLDAAMRDAFRKARRFLMKLRGLPEDEALSLLSVAVDFGVTQVVDGNWGVHAVISKALFN